MNLIIEILQLIGVLFSAFMVLIILCVIQSNILTKEEAADQADFMDEFLYGEKFR